MNADGEPLGATADAALVNFWLHALFSQIDMTLKDTLVTTSNNTYPYQAYIETFLSFGTESKGELLTEDNRPISGSHITDLINMAIQTLRKIKKTSNWLGML